MLAFSGTPFRSLTAFTGCGDAATVAKAEPPLIAALIKEDEAAFMLFHPPFDGSRCPSWLDGSIVGELVEKMGYLCVL